MSHVLEQIEKLREKSSRKYAGLAHDFGAGAACTKCEGKCAGFQLHYWRKICLNCRCPKEDHDIDESVWRDKIRWDHIGELVSKTDNKFSAPKKFILKEHGHQDSKTSHGKPGTGAKDVHLEWAPPNASPELVRMYFNSVPREKWPVTGSTAAEVRRKKLESQLPLQDIIVECLVDSKPDERQGLEKYIEHVSTGIIGQAEIMRFHYPVAEVGYAKPQVPAMASSITGQVSQQPLAMARREIDKYPASQMADEDHPKPGFRDEDLVGKMGKMSMSGIAPQFLQGKQPLHQAESSMVHQEPGKVFPFHHSPGKKPPAIPPKPWKQKESCELPGVEDENGTCNQCAGVIQPGEVVVAVPGELQKLNWHPNCFVCSCCGERLEDLIYCQDGDKVYCGRDYAEKVQGIPRCKGCDQLIFARQYTKAEGAFWHLEHFACWQCDVTLGGKTYTCIDGNPHCTPCFVAKETQICRSCSGGITPGTPRIGLQDCSWHLTPACFACEKCNQPLINKKILFKNQQLFCSSECWNSFNRQP